jgi:hypothetical protein
MRIARRPWHVVGTALLLTFPCVSRAQTRYTVTVTAASDSTAVFAVRVIAPGWVLTVPGASSTTIVDDTIRVNTPLRLELSVADAAVAEFVALDSARISVRVEGRNLAPRTCESPPWVLTKCATRSVVAGGAGTHVVLDIVGSNARVSAVR